MPGVTGTLVMDLDWCGGRSDSVRCWILGRLGWRDAEDGIFDIVYKSNMDCEQEEEENRAEISVVAELNNPKEWELECFIDCEKHNICWTGCSSFQHPRTDSSHRFSRNDWFHSNVPAIMEK